MRLLGAETAVQLDAGHGPMPLIVARSITVRGLNSVAAVIRPLASRDVTNSKARATVPELIGSAVRWQYLCGVCLILLDELQFLTQSATASTLVAQVMLALSYVGVPYAVICNYSVGHRLKGRRAEERQRLIGRPVILLPDAAGSKDWKTILKEYQRTVPGVYEFDFCQIRGDALGTHGWSEARPCQVARPGLQASADCCPNDRCMG